MPAHPVVALAIALLDDDARTEVLDELEQLMGAAAVGDPRYWVRPADLVARCDDAIAHGARTLDLLAARQPALGRCPGCGCTLGGGDVICDRCHEQHPGHRPSADPLGADFLELARSFGD